MPELYCETHKTSWFKKGKMQGYAHPLKDSSGETTGWCPMPKTFVQPAPEPPVSASVEPPPAAKANGSTMSKDEWREKDKATRDSIHRQSASDRVVSLITAGAILPTVIPAWLNYFTKYYDTDETQHLPPTGLEKAFSVAAAPNSPAEVKETPPSPPVVEATTVYPPLKDFADLMFRCGRNGWTPTKINKMIGIINFKECKKSPDEVWQMIVEKCGVNPTQIKP